jgi:hypothetical protein
MKKKSGEPDANDIAKAHGIDALRSSFDGAVALKLNQARRSWPEPDMRLVEDDRVSAPAIDDEILPADWGAWITAQAAACGCPRDYVAAALIGAASAWIGNARRCAATADWTEPSNLWFALIGGPSTGKTSALRPLISASSTMERDAETTWRTDCARHDRDAEAADARNAVWRANVRKAAEQGASPPGRPADAETLPEPARPRVMTMDASTEELQRMLADNPRGLLCVRDELCGWLSSFDQYKAFGKGADRAFHLEAWNGGSYVCDRVKYHGEPILIEHAAVAIIGGMVPDRLREVLADADDGLAARFLYVWPEPSPIKSLADSGDIEATKRFGILAAAARRLRALAMAADYNGAPAPYALRLSADAFRLFDEFDREAKQLARSLLGFAAGWHGKNSGRALRLALNFELLAWAARGGAEPANVSADAMVRACGYLDYASEMIERVQGGFGIGGPEADAAFIAKHLLTTGAVQINERELYQTRRFRWCRETKRRAAAFDVLQRCGWVRRATSPIGGGRPPGDWDISPLLLRKGKS